MTRAIALFLLLVGGIAAAMAQPAPKKPAAATKQAPAAQPGDGRCIGVLSQIGEKFIVKKHGILALQNEYDAVPIHAWHIDELVVARISAFFNKQAVVRRIPYSADLKTSEGRGSGEAQRSGFLRALPAGLRCARYIMVTPLGSNQKISPEAMTGLGIHTASALLAETRVFVLVQLELYDGTTFERLRQRRATIGQSSFVTGFDGPSRDVGKSLFPKSPADAAQDARLREITRELVAQGIDMTLPDLQVIETGGRPSGPTLQRTD